MALTEIDAVRLKAADRATRYRETFRGNGSQTDFQLTLAPIQTAPAARVYINNVLKTVVTHYTVDSERGIVTFGTAPAAGEEVRVEYMATFYTDEEVTYFYEQGGSNSTLGAVYMLLAWSADKAKVAKRQTLAGGGGIGTDVLDTSVTSKELRDSAKAWYVQWQNDEGDSTPFEQITEVAWTPFQARRMFYDRLWDS